MKKAKQNWRKLREKHQDHPDFHSELKHIFVMGEHYIVTHGKQMFVYGALSGGILISAIFAVVNVYACK